MKSIHSKAIASVSICAALTLSCSAAPGEPSQRQVSAQSLTSPVGLSLAQPTAAVHAGYVHRIERTSFDPAMMSDMSRLEVAPRRVNTYFAGKIQRTEGPRGIWAIDTVSGWSGASPSPEVLNNYRPYGSTMEEHNAKVKEYFIAAGLPADQIGEVGGTTQVMETGPTDHWDQHATRLLGYTTVIRRVIDGVPISDSTAIASLADSGKAIRESVYWPAIPKAVVAEAKGLMVQLAGEGMTNFRARLPSEVDWSDASARVVVRHRSDSSEGPPQAHAVVEMTASAGAVRHFESTGAEFETAVSR
jgi:hypothetical protein